MYHNGHLVWYAVMVGKDDTDHGCGSYNKRHALAMARILRRQGCNSVYIAVIDPADDHCIAVITD